MCVRAQLPNVLSEELDQVSPAVARGTLVAAARTAVCRTTVRPLPGLNVHGLNAAGSRSRLTT